VLAAATDILAGRRKTHLSVVAASWLVISLVILKCPPAVGVYVGNPEYEGARQVCAVDYATATAAVCSSVTAIWDVRLEARCRMLSRGSRGGVKLALERKALGCFEQSGNSRIAGWSGGASGILLGTAASRTQLQTSRQSESGLDAGCGVGVEVIKSVECGVVRLRAARLCASYGGACERGWRRHYVNW
jgi:hypothetical protein